jgi:hypothetical protein
VALENYGLSLALAWELVDQLMPLALEWENWEASLKAALRVALRAAALLQQSLWTQAFSVKRTVVLAGGTEAVGAVGIVDWHCASPLYSSWWLNYGDYATMTDHQLKR